MSEATTKKITPLSNSETAAFCSQLAMILKAGISALEGVSLMLEDAKDNDEKQLLSSINDTLLMTGSLYEALKDTGAFSSYMISMVRIGEQSGRLDEVMASLADYYEKEASLVMKIKSAITYPCVMIIMMVAVILILITKVMPVFAQVFRQLGSEMTGFSKGILNVGIFLNKHWIILVAVIAVLIALALYLTKTKKGQAAFMAMIEKRSSDKKLTDQISAYRFANGMALTLSSGLSPEECLKLAEDLVEDGNFKKKVEECHGKVESGEDFSKSLLECGIFTGVYTRMITLASRTGAMEEVMQKISDRYSEEVDTRMGKMLSSIEPTLVVILSVVVGIILLSVMLPLLSTMATL